MKSLVFLGRLMSDMVKILFVFIFFLQSCMYVSAQDFDAWFQDKTLRLDYTFSGDNCSQNIYLDEMKSSENWYGRRVNLDSLLLLGNGQLCMKDSESGRVLYRYSFSTLFQEWQTTEEATRVKKSFENVFLVPFPKKPVDITITLTDTHNKINGLLTHHVDPQDILIRPAGADERVRWDYLVKSGDSKERLMLLLLRKGIWTAKRMSLKEIVWLLLMRWLRMSLSSRCRTGSIMWL